MAYQPITNVSISLQTAGISGQGFGTPLFASSHRYFPERVRSYTSLNAVAADFPTTSNGYLAAQAYFSNTPSPTVVKLGRREADLTLTVAVGSTEASLTFSASDGTNTHSLNVNVTGQADEDAVATAIMTAIEADGDIAPLVTVTAASNVVTVVAVGTNTFWIDNLSSELTEGYTTTETAPDLISAIEAVDTDWYFFSADDHTETFVLAASQDIESRTKLYFFSSAEQAALTPYVSGSATDILGQIKDTNRDRTKGFFHQNADTTFPECLYVGYNAPFQAGGVTWTNLQVALAASENPSTSVLLSDTEKGYLEDRDSAYVDRISGQTNAIRNGRVASGQPIDFIRGRDNLQEDLNVDLQNLLLQQQGGKLPYNDSGITRIESRVSNVLTRYVARLFINADFELTFPLTDAVPVQDRQNRIYQSGSFRAELVGAIESITITGVLTLQL